jgi:HPt (histidine-containing phosphotransfer) domain-containing protein
VAPGLDIRGALASLGGNEQLYERVACMFVEREAGFGERFAATRAGADAGATERLAHDLKCEAATLGAMVLSEAAAALEHACSVHADETQIDVLVEAVTTQLDPVITGLRSMSHAARA